MKIIMVLKGRRGGGLEALGTALEEEHDTEGNQRGNFGLDRQHIVVVNTPRRSITLGGGLRLSFPPYNMPRDILLLKPKENTNAIRLQHHSSPHSVHLPDSSATATAP